MTQAFFGELVGTSVTPAHCFDSDELTDLTPALDSVTTVDDGMAAEAGVAAATGYSSTPNDHHCC